jgi:hypothetical protein
VNASLLLCGLLLTHPAAEPPVVGRPPEWSGAIGGPFVVTATAEPTALTAEEPLTLTVRIAVAPGGSAGNLRALARPPLAKQEAFKPFAVEDVDDGFSDTPLRREFRYRLRPRTADVKEIPRVKLVYFNPLLPPGRDYQTTYSGEVPLTVKPRAVAATAGEVPEWIIHEWETRDEFRLSPTEQWRNDVFELLGLDPYPERRSRSGRLIAATALAGPLLICGVWYAVWHHRHPDAAQLARRRRSRAAAAALRDLRKARADDAGSVRAVVCAFLRARAGLPATASTLAEVGRFLRDSGYPTGRVAAVEELLRWCDRARFSPGHEIPTHLSTDAERLILELEAEP